MKIFPAVKTSLIDDCEPGDLIRCSLGGGGFWALVSVNSMNNQKSCVCLNDIGELRGPVTLDDYFPRTVLSFGNDYRIELDQEGPIELNPRQMWERPGCMCLSGSELHLFVAMGRAAAQGVLTGRCYRFSDGNLGAAPDINNVGVYGNWAMYLGEQPRAFEAARPIYKFSWASPVQQVA